MKSFKKIFLLCLSLILCNFFFNSCESDPYADSRHAKESFQLIKECIDSKNAVELKKMFNSVGASSLNESDIEDLFNLFPSGITLIETPHDDHVIETKSIGEGVYIKDICWGREIIDNETGERFGMSVLECTEDWTNEDLGIIGLIFYNKYDERAFDAWWNLLEDDERPNGIVIYKK